MSAPSSSSSSDEKRDLPPAKVRKKSKKHCYMHLASVKKEEVQEFTRTRWITYTNSAKRWLRLPAGESNTIAQSYEHCIEMDFENVPQDAGFHATCYRRFLDKKHLDAAEKRTTQCSEDQDADTGESAASGSSASTSECPRKKLRSTTGLPVTFVGPVLPALCIICKKTDKYITVAGKRHKDHLSQAETTSAGM